MGALFSQFLVFLVSAIPLYFALKLIKGKAKKLSFTKVFLVNILVAAVASTVSSSFGFLGGAVAFILALFVYKEMFEIDWLTAFLVWLMQIVMVALLFWALILLGISLIVL